MKCYNPLGGLFIAVCGVKARNLYPPTNVGSRVVLARAYQEDGQTPNAHPAQKYTASISLGSYQHMSSLENILELVLQSNTHCIVEVTMHAPQGLSILQNRRNH